MQGSGTVVAEHVSAREAAELAGLSARTVRRWISEGRLRAEKRGRSFRIAVADLAAEVGRPLGVAAGPVGTERAGALGSGEGRMEGELTGLVRELMAELVQATEAAARWRTLAQVLIVQLEQTEARLGEGSAEPGPGRRSGDASERGRGGVWRELLQAADDPSLSARPRNAQD